LGEKEREWGREGRRGRRGREIGGEGEREEEGEGAWID
jgi:hypothetical protein